MAFGGQTKIICLSSAWKNTINTQKKTILMCAHTHTHPEKIPAKHKGAPSSRVPFRSARARLDSYSNIVPPGVVSGVNTFSCLPAKWAHSKLFQCIYERTSPSRAYSPDIDAVRAPSRHNRTLAPFTNPPTLMLEYVRWRPCVCVSMLRQPNLHTHRSCTLRCILASGE